MKRIDEDVNVKQIIVKSDNSYESLKSLKDEVFSACKTGPLNSCVHHLCLTPLIVCFSLGRSKG